MTLNLIQKCFDFLENKWSFEVVTISSKRKLLKLFEPDIERYIFDFNLSMKEWRFQADSRQDARYYGNRVNFQKSAWICYAEWDLYVSVYHTQELLLEVLEKVCKNGDIKHVDTCEDEEIIALVNGRFPIV